MLCFRKPTRRSVISVSFPASSPKQAAVSPRAPIIPGAGGAGVLVQSGRYQHNHGPLQCTKFPVSSTHACTTQPLKAGVYTRQRSSLYLQTGNPSPATARHFYMFCRMVAKCPDLKSRSTSTTNKGDARVPLRTGTLARSSRTITPPARRTRPALTA